MNDEKLIKKIKNKKQSALNEIIKKYTPYISAVIYNIGKDKLTKEDIEEILSDVFVSLWIYSDKLNCKNGNLKSFLATIARNKAINHLKKFKHFYILDENIISDDNSYDFIEKNEQNKFIYNKIIELGEPDSEIFIRYYYNEENAKTISKDMGINYCTVKTKLKRGREKLRQVCKDMEVII